MKALVNIGMERNDGGRRVSPGTVVDVLDDLGILVVDSRMDGTGKKPTFVAIVDDATPAQIYAACHVLAQDCIAVYDLKRCIGELVGPKAKEWGRFDPQYFRVL